MAEVSDGKATDTALLHRFKESYLMNVDPADRRALLVGIIAHNILTAALVETSVRDDRQDEAAELIYSSGTHVVEVVCRALGISPLPGEEVDAMTAEAGALVATFIEENQT